jgi:hypothetical protein
MNLRDKQRKFAALCYDRLLQDMEYHCDNLLERLNLLTLHNRPLHFDALFLMNICIGTKYCPSVLETVDVGFLLGTCSLALLATALQLDLSQPQMQFVNSEIRSGNRV